MPRSPKSAASAGANNATSATGAPSAEAGTNPARGRIDAQRLWELARVGAPALSPDGDWAVAPVTHYDTETNQGHSSLWLLPTRSSVGRVGQPRRLTRTGRKDGQPKFSPDGRHIAFLAQREQEGQKDDEAQLYCIARDGGEAHRAGTLATGVEAFRWCPDGQHLLLVSWVWPELRGAAAQAQALKTFKARKETGYATSEALYRWWDHFVPQGRAAHLHRLNLKTGRCVDLFENTPYQLSRCEPDDNAFAISPDGRHVCFVWDASPEQRLDARHVLVEMDIATGQAHTVVQHSDWDFAAPSYSPDGRQLAFTASHQGQKHTLPKQLALLERASGQWQVPGADWDHDVHPPLRWQADGRALYFQADAQGRTHVWRCTLGEASQAGAPAAGAARFEVAVAGGTVSAFDLAGSSLLTLTDSAAYPARLHIHHPGQPTRRLEHFNDRALAALDLGRHEEVWFTGALGEPVQMWLHYPPGFDPAKTYPLMHSIHGGPHTAPGDTWHWRWNNKVFAAQGYVVACVNYHGSSGFGHRFLDSITQRWGELELQDVEAATDWLLAQPWADARRVFATGGSYGGYMVAWMNGHVPAGRYAAFICHAGCYDWTAMFADDAWAWHAKELGAWYWEDPERVARQSPHRLAGNMATPTLVIHGAHDYRVPDQQGLAYYNTLKARGVKARLLWFPDENHWVLKPRNSLLWYREFFDWLRAYDPAASTANSSAAANAPQG